MNNVQECLFFEKDKTKGYFNQEELYSFNVVIIKVTQLGRHTDCLVPMTLAGRPVFMCVIHWGHTSSYTVTRDKVLIIFVPQVHSRKYKDISLWISDVSKDKKGI